MMNNTINTVLLFNVKHFFSTSGHTEMGFGLFTFLSFIPECTVRFNVIPDTILYIRVDETKSHFDY